MKDIRDRRQWYWLAERINGVWYKSMPGFIVLDGQAEAEIERDVRKAAGGKHAVLRRALGVDEVNDHDVRVMLHEVWKEQSWREIGDAIQRQLDELNGV